ncbi:MAG: NADAR family protein [Firmicutes bacterium]|nr:NADAR family protein [Bacillota bacterium]
MQKIICFDNSDSKNIWFSNWYLSDFEIGGKKFASIEQYMMFEKAMSFKDVETEEKVMEITDAAEIKALGRQVKNYDDRLWNGRRQLVVYNGLLAKFGQNPGLLKKLLDTGSAILAECEPSDKIWGIGMALNDERCMDQAKWQGQNLLGYTLMEVRSALQHD